MVAPERPGVPSSARWRPGPVTVLVSILAVLLTIWVVGALLLVRYADELPAEPTPTPTPTPTTTAPNRFG